MQQDHTQSGVGDLSSAGDRPQAAAAKPSPVTTKGVTNAQSDGVRPVSAASSSAARGTTSSETGPPSVVGASVTVSLSLGQNAQAASAHSYSPETLARIQARKKQNYAARVKEFAQLRQIRLQPSPVLVTAPSVELAFSPGSVASKGVGATLQKIDAIEAQLSRQWWQSPPMVQVPATVTPLQSDRASALPLDDGVLDEKAPFGMPAAQLRNIPTLGMESVVTPEPLVEISPPVVDRVEPQPFCVVPEVEDAAILFAHGDFDAAKASLLQLLVQALDATPSDPVRVNDIWLMVLDVYRATDDADGFEALAWDYAAHFGIAVPEWYSLAVRLGVQSVKATEVSEEVTPKQAPLTQSEWAAPAVLGVDAVLALDAVVLSRAMPWRLDWSGLERIEPVALPLLFRVVEGWLRSPGEFVCMGAAALRSVLESHTGVGQRSTSSQWWMLHLAFLRWLHAQDAFEQVALNYCITYEVSPPSWEDAVCTCVLTASQGNFAGALSHTLPAHLEGTPALAGVLEGDITFLLSALEGFDRNDDVLDINCEALIRMDLIAVSCLLDWCMQRYQEGKRMRFVQVRSWITVLWQLLGLHRYARIQALVMVH